MTKSHLLATAVLAASLLAAPAWAQSARVLSGEEIKEFIGQEATIQFKTTDGTAAGAITWKSDGTGTGSVVANGRQRPIKATWRVNGKNWCRTIIGLQQEECPRWRVTGKQVESLMGERVESVGTIQR